MSDHSERELRERKIVQLKRELEAHPPQGCLKALLGNIGAIIFSAVISIIALFLLFWMTSDLFISIIIAVVIYMLLCLLYGIGTYKTQKDIRNRKEELDQLLREEREDIEGA